MVNQEIICILYKMTYLLVGLFFNRQRNRRSIELHLEKNLEKKSIAKPRKTSLENDKN